VGDTRPTAATAAKAIIVFLNMLSLLAKKLPTGWIFIQRKNVSPTRKKATGL
jgi:hypothetical protein